MAEKAASALTVMRRGPELRRAVELVFTKWRQSVSMYRLPVCVSVLPGQYWPKSHIVIDNGSLWSLSDGACLCFVPLMCSVCSFEPCL